MVSVKVRARRGISVVAAVVLGVSACGGAAGGPSAGGRSASATPLRLGALINVTGPTTTGEAGARDVLRGWARAVNATGGVAGHPVAIDVVDTKGDAPTAAAAARRMAADDRVVGVILYDASTESNVAGVLTRAKLPVIGGLGYTPTAWGKLPNWLPIATSFPAVIDMGMVMAKQVGAHRPVFPVCAENPSCAAAGPLAEKASRRLGMQYAGTLPTSVSAPDYTAQCLRFKSQGVDYVMLGLTTAASLRLVAGCRTQGYTGKWGLFDGSVWPKVMKENDPGVPISVALSAFPWFVDDAPVARYRETMKKQNVPETSWGSPHGTAAYATVELFRKALTGAATSLPKRPTRADVVRAYAAIRNERLDGLLPQPITFTPGKPEPLVGCFWLATFAGGRFTGAVLDKPVCDRPSV